MSDSAQEPALYAMLAGRIDDVLVQRLLNRMAEAVSQGVGSVHLMLHSTGGVIGDGIALYNTLRNLPLELVTYNAGMVQSIAVIVYLAGRRRIASDSATFMLHKATFYSGGPTTSMQLNAAVQSLMVDDARIEAILKQYLAMPQEKWNVHRFSDLFITAAEAREFGLATDVGDFRPPPGARLVNV